MSLPGDEVVPVEVRDPPDIIESVAVVEYIEELESTEDLSGQSEDRKDEGQGTEDYLFFGGGERPKVLCSCVGE